MMIGSKIRFRSNLYLIDGEENYEDLLDFKEVFNEFRVTYNVVIRGQPFRDYSLGGVTVYSPETEESRTGVILPMTAEDLQFDSGGTHNLQSIKIFMEKPKGFILYYARRIDEEDKRVLGSSLVTHVNKGATVLPIASVADFEAGMKIRIFEGANGVVLAGESAVIQSIEFDSLVLVSPLKLAFASGASVVIDNV